ncbi:MAG: rhomboid family intramembrane serine protease [Xanthomonadales bacterium]|nr:hypothetical protein [Xanthomonadales bacterium]MCC6594060.1 rhomboid family intramembrane serine protease [Xanthomonadales bacterium]MCE7930890.1 rhomboid family intramembrane serine protease [Xanthomonadales bacterium PRO6]
MLIIPLHRKPTLANFPWVTALLIAVNVLVYIGPQARDERALAEAADFYRRSGLLELELDALREHLLSRERPDLATTLQSLPPPAQAQLAVQVQAIDPTFATRISRTPLHDRDNPRATSVRVQRAEFERRLLRAFTPRHVLLFHEPSAPRYFSSMFLHGSGGHLIGNMVMLALLGLMTEAALGPWLFLGVYLLGGLCAGTVSVVRHLGDFGSLLGASGAIAALMGACCVVWGMRRIRVFYWFFVIFDSVRVPALLLLPVWLGWELYQMVSLPEAKVAFDAHAGGIVAGALVAATIRKLGWERREVLDESHETSALPDLYGPTRAALGRLEFARAHQLSTRLVEQHPTEREAWLLRLRACRDRPQETAYHEAARRLLVGGLQPSAKLDDDIALFEEYLNATGHRPRLSTEDLLAVGSRWFGGGRRHAAAPIVHVLLNTGEPREAARRLALRLALSALEDGDIEAARDLCQRLHANSADSEEARKLQRLLS